MIAGAAHSGNMDIIKWAQRYPRSTIHIANELPYLQKPCRLSKIAHIEACKGGKLEVIDWLKNRNCPTHRTAIYSAAELGNVQVVNHLLKNIDVPEYLCESAARGGHFELAKQLHTKDGHVRVDKLAGYAASYGNIEYLEWLIEKKTKISLDTCGSYALGSGQLETLKWLQNKGWKCKYRYRSDSAKSGRIEVVQWAKDNGCEWNEVTMSTAAGFGHLNLVKWLRANGCPWSSETTQKAALKGQLEVLQWLIANSCPYELQTNIIIVREFEISALVLLEKGHVEVVMFLLPFGLYLDPECYNPSTFDWNSKIWLNDWLFENGCPTKYLWITAIRNSSFAILEWLKSKNCVWRAQKVFKYINRLEISALEWLQTNGYEKHPTAFLAAVRAGDLGTMKWMKENEWPWTSMVCTKAATNNNFAIFKWAVEAGCPVNVEQCAQSTTCELIKSYIDNLNKKIE